MGNRDNNKTSQALYFKASCGHSAALIAGVSAGSTTSDSVTTLTSDAVEPPRDPPEQIKSDRQALWGMCTPLWSCEVVQNHVIKENRTHTHTHTHTRRHSYTLAVCPSLNNDVDRLCDTGHVLFQLVEAEECVCVCVCVCNVFKFMVKVSDFPSSVVFLFSILQPE